ncbi:sulfotransferase family domain-containing protein [Purpureocillium lilacinum]|uniref:Sulfotransferase family domain-containing protein n=1 Tax=Purpureocillium lilacinum TaxID=33203 RepID=A0A179HCM1_PURLI|nr:sulfotransferase family domain-containing protein [Purpureocillium lilacinum]
MTDPRRILLVSYPRSASNLLVRMLGLDDQPDVPQNVSRGYHLKQMASLAFDEDLWEKPLHEWGDSKQRLRQAAADGFDALEKTRAAGDSHGKITFTKEHATLLTDPTVLNEFIFGREGAVEQRWRIDEAGCDKAPEEYTALNDTIFSDAYLRQWKMAFVIRHPAMAFPSLYRILLNAAPNREFTKGTANYLPVYMTIRWNRRLYDLATKFHRETANGAARDTEAIAMPLVLDADDVIGNPRAVQKFAALLRLDPDKTQSSWSPITQEEKEKLPARAQIMLSTLNASTGIIADKSAASIDITAEASKWAEEFGLARAQQLEKWVREAMPDYEYLKERRIQV